jgi:hypothetical protein
MPEHKRNGTRASCDIPATLALLNFPDLSAEPCRIIVANPHECGIRFGRSLEDGTRVQLQGLPTNLNVIARVVTCTDLRPYEKFWFIQLTLAEPGNVWGIENPPEDWQRLS